MGMQLPDWLREALSWIGCTWPEADETLLRACGDYWRTFAEDAETHAAVAIKAVNDMLAENHSPGLTAFEKYWDKVAGESAYMPDCRIVAGAVSVAFLAASILVLTLKILVIVQLIAFAIILAAAIATAVITLGTSLAAAAEAAIAVNRSIVVAVNATIRALRDLGPPLTELATEHLSEKIVRLDGRPVHHDPDHGVDDYRTPEERRREQQVYERRKQHIAYDHAEKRSTKETEREAEVALGLEAVGRIDAEVRNSNRPEADFQDGNGQEWDVKAFGTRTDQNGNPLPGSGYNRAEAEKGIGRKLKRGINVALDLANLTPAERADLRALIVKKGWEDQVVIY